MPRIQVVAVTAAPTSLARRVRVATGSIPGGAFLNVNVPLPTAMPSTSYVAEVAVEDANGDLRVACITARTTTSVTVRIQNTNALTARTGVVHVRAEHD